MPRKLISIITEPEIKKLKRGGHSIRYRIPAHDGKPESKSPWKKYPDATTKALAMQAAEQYRQELLDELNNYAARGDMSLGEYAQKWHDDREDNGEIQEPTWQREESQIAAIRECSLANYAIEEITEEDIGEFKREMHQKGWSTDKQSKVFKKLKQILKYAESRAIIRHDPSRHVKGIKTTPTERKSLTREQQHTLLKALSEEPKDGRRAAVLITLATGLRIGEVLGLVWNDLDQKEQTLNISKQIDRRRKTKPPKNNSMGILPLDDNTFIWLQDWKVKTYAALVKKKRRGRDCLTEKEYREVNKQLGTTPICCNTQFNYYQHSNFERWWRRFIVEHGLGVFNNVFKKKNKRGENETHYTEFEGIEFHELRHTMATETLGSGADIQTTKTIMRHKSIRTTELYLHSIDENMMDAVQKVAQMRQEWGDEEKQKRYDTVYYKSGAPKRHRKRD